MFGKEIKARSGAVLENAYLAYQVLDQIPQPPRDILERVWGRNFKCYTARTGEGQIAGVVWELDEEDLKTLKEWEFIGEWRELVQVKVKASDGQELTAYTEKAPDTAPVKETVDGLNYEDNLNKEGRLQKETDEDEWKIAELREQIKEHQSLTASASL